MERSCRRGLFQENIRHSPKGIGWDNLQNISIRIAASPAGIRIEKFQNCNVTV
jgi:hypothetical protein